MPTVRFTYALKRFFPAIRKMAASSGTLPGILQEMEAAYPGLRSYILDEQGNLRKHVNIFIDGEMIADRLHLSDPLSENSEVYIMQALSGG